MSTEQPNQHTGWDLPKRIWGKISEPRVINFATWIGYWHALIPGVYSIFQPPSSIQGAIGDYAMLVIAILVTIGGAIGLLTCLNGAWWLERWAVVSLIAGAFMYYLIVITLHVSSPGNRLLQAGIIGCAICLLICRLLRVSTRQQDPNIATPKHR
ncbi:hypothetical protein QDX23_03560 [Auritidibacter ignavus]|uniref:hypothetical protein n=1 Tax=Auritidibacter ignavus TaxID=678932 RepID=UPI00244D65B4|nr:hypothetical protein [Auritidibacter ignavus]WGH91457.1 hypothetical protein QDX23_03560 [Auritidibacter ignavus]